MLAGRSVAEIGGGHSLGYAGRLLRLAGARVVKEEPAGGDPVRESARSWDFLAEGKQLGSTSGRKRAGRGPGPRPISEAVLALAKPPWPVIHWHFNQPIPRTFDQRRNKAVHAFKRNQCPDTFAPHCFQ